MRVPRSCECRQRRPGPNRMRGTRSSWLSGTSGSSSIAMPADRALFSDKLDQAVEAISDAFSSRSIRHALIGGLATSMRGRPRYTQDVDFLLEVPQLALPALLDDLVAR